MVTLVLANVFLPTIGGSVNWMVNTYSRYPSNRVVIVAPNFEDPNYSDEVLAFPVLRLGRKIISWDLTCSKTFYSFVYGIWHLRKICRQYKVSQVHCANVLPEGLFAIWLKRFWGIPYLVYAHGEEITACQTSQKLRWVMRNIFKEASAIIANSENTKTLLKNSGMPVEGIHVIHPGVDVKKFQERKELAPIIRNRHGLGKAPVLLHVGRLHRRKGQDMLIQALPLILRKFPETKCLFVGTGEDSSYLRLLVQEYKVCDQVNFVGKIPDSELGGYYAICDIFVMPNRMVKDDIEGFGMVFLEAAALGKPVIGGISGGTDSAILDGITGLRVDGSNVKDIAQAVISLLSKPANARIMGERGMQRVEQEFTWEVVLKKTMALSSTIANL